MNKIAIYTAVSNNYDEIKDPTIIPKNVDFIAFTDNTTEIKSKIWKEIKMPESDLDSIRKCRQIKTQPHVFLPEYDYSIWIDGNIDIIGDVNVLLERLYNLGDYKFYSFEHPSRNDIYEEANECIAMNKDDKKTINNQIIKYKNEGYPSNQGLIESNVIIRNHMDSNTIDVMNDWWKEILNGSRRDQLSFNYVSWKNNYDYGILAGNSRGNSEYFIARDHNTSLNEYINRIKYKFKKILS